MKERAEVTLTRRQAEPGIEDRARGELDLAGDDVLEGALAVQLWPKPAESILAHGVTMSILMAKPVAPPTRPRP